MSADAPSRRLRLLVVAEGVVLSSFALFMVGPERGLWSFLWKKDVTREILADLGAEPYLEDGSLRVQFLQSRFADDSYMRYDDLDEFEILLIRREDGAIVRRLTLWEYAEYLRRL